MRKGRSVSLEVFYINADLAQVAAQSGSTQAAAQGTATVAGQTVTLNNAPLYASSTTNKPSAHKTGVYYLYDSAVINGRRRITNLLSRVGKKPVGQNVTGWVNDADCKGVTSAGAAESKTAAAKKTGTDIAEYVESLTYVDSAADNSDSVDITLDAQDGKWLRGWMPNKGATLSPRIVGRDWDSTGDTRAIHCGLFVLDDISFSDAPTTLQIGGVSKPSNTDFSELEREYVWKNTSIKRIASTIAARYGLQFAFDADDYDIESDEQDGTDSSYLNELCKNYGLILKVYASRLWIYDRERYKEKRAAVTVDRTQIKPGSFSYRTTLFGTYTGGYFDYTDPDKDCDISCSVGGGTHTKSVNRRASSVYDASVQLCAEINNANHGQIKIRFTMPGAWHISAAMNILLTGYGDGENGGLNGKYFVDKVTHKVSRGGYETQIEASAVRPGFHHWDVGGKIEYQKTAAESKENYSSTYETTSPAANAASAAAGAVAGAAVTLNKAPLYVSSTATNKAGTKSGTYYFYDGILINGRYRITNSAARCGKLPVGQNVTGWVPASYCGGGSAGNGTR